MVGLMGDWVGGWLGAWLCVCLYVCVISRSWVLKRTNVSLTECNIAKSKNLPFGAILRLS